MLDIMESAEYVRKHAEQKPEDKNNKTPKNNPSRMNRFDVRVNIPFTNRQVRVPVVAGAVGLGVGAFLAFGGHSEAQVSNLPPLPPGASDASPQSKVSPELGPAAEEVKPQITAQNGIKVEAVTVQPKNSETTKIQNNFDTNKIMETVPMNLKEEAKISIPLIIKAFSDINIDSKDVLAFAFANAEYEANFDVSKQEYQGKEQAEKLGYDGGFPGGGLIQITGEANLRKYSKYLSSTFPDRYQGIDLVKNPELALRPDMSAAILAGFVKEEGIADLIIKGKYDEARKKIVGNYDENDEHNKGITKYIINRTKSYRAALN